LPGGSSVHRMLFLQQESIPGVGDPLLNGLTCRYYQPVLSYKTYSLQKLFLSLKSMLLEPGPQPLLEVILEGCSICNWELAESDSHF
jgi:hypothetical protein